MKTYTLKVIVNSGTNSIYKDEVVQAETVVVSEGAYHFVKNYTTGDGPPELVASYPVNFTIIHSIK